ncbi:unnamed protein product [Candidula unifasciata]|uniref:Solute carrier family 23 member 2 n=1 Tax=Candidula unifasciata TaxID=100452 RepID=A0A8S3ZTB7_9EUPU|nr:unnamed protein product [Candidula unifasciata]
MKDDSVHQQEPPQIKDDSVLGIEQYQMETNPVLDFQHHQMRAPFSQCTDRHLGTQYDNQAFEGEGTASCEINNNMTDNSLRQRSKATEDDSAHQIIIEVGEAPTKPLIYGLTATPPVHFLILFALQQSFLAISTPLGTAVIVAEAVCAQEEASIKVRILSSTMLMMGLSTFAITTFGVRLPIFQGPSVSYIIPLIIMMAMPEFKCPETFTVTDPETNITVLMADIGNNTLVRNEDIAIARINAYAGSLMISGGVHFLIGPVTIVPVVLLFGIYIHKVVVGFAESNWPVAVITAGMCIILSLYLSNRSTPIPFWSKNRGFHIIWQPLHQTFSILLSIITGWIVSYIMTEYGALSKDPSSKEFNARTDARLHVLTDTAWFLYPYPGQFGAPTFSSAALVSFMVSTILSILDSIGDYSASAKIARAPPPPSFALNRGIAVEGLMSFLSGSLGCGHATVSYGENIGAMSISKVASRSVFQVVGVIYIVCAFLGKLGAFFSTIPYSVIGGSQIVTFGILIGIIMSYLQLIDLNSLRNMSIIGMALLLGMMLPYWCTKNSGSIDTGNAELNNIIILSLSNPSFVGGIFACFLDNTVPGTLKERGILSQLKNGASSGKDDAAGDYDHGIEVYRLPWIPNSFRKTRLARIIPLFDLSE